MPGTPEGKTETSPFIEAGLNARPCDRRIASKGREGLVDEREFAHASAKDIGHIDT